MIKRILNRDPKKFRVSKINPLSNPMPQCKSNKIPKSTYQYKETKSASQFSWNIALDDELRIESKETQGVYKMSTNYTLDDKHYSVTVYKKDCETPPTPANAIAIIPDDIKNNAAGGTNDVELMFLYNQSVVEDSDIWIANNTGGNVEFCIKLRNFLQEGSDTFAREIHFHETKYKIEVDSTTDFNSSIALTRLNATEGGVETIDYEEDIVSFFCNNTYGKTEDGKEKPLTQGDFAQICVETKEGSAFAVESIKELEVSQKGEKSYTYVNNFVDSPLALSRCDTTKENTTDAVCYTKMQLLSAFFNDGTPDPLDVSGTVKLKYIGVGGRLLSVDIPMNLRVGDYGHTNGKGRELQVAEENGGSFSATIELAPSLDSAGDASLGSLFPAILVSFLAGCTSFVFALMA